MADDNKTITDDEVPSSEPGMTDEEYFAADEQAAQAASFKKKKQIAAGAAISLLTIVALIVYSCQPPKGTIMYPVCAAFLEQIVDYPPTLQHLYIEQFPRAVRIYYNHTDAFGQFRQDMIECVASREAMPNLVFEKVLINRKEVDKTRVDTFNKSIDTIMLSEPDLTLPEPPERVW